MLSTNSNSIATTIDFTSNFTTKIATYQDHEIQTWIVAARFWALVVSLIGIPGNFITASTILHQIFLHLRKQRLQSVSESSFHQLKVIREGTHSESSCSSLSSTYQRKRSISSTKAATSGPPPLTLNIPCSRRSSSKKFSNREKRPSIVNTNGSRDSSPDIQCKSNYSFKVKAANDSKTDNNIFKVRKSYDTKSVSYHPNNCAVNKETDSNEVQIYNEVNSLQSSPHDLSYTLSNCSIKRSQQDISGEAAQREATPNGTSSISTSSSQTPKAAQRESTPNRTSSISTTSSQTPKPHEKVSVRKSLSIRSQSISLNRHETSNYSASHSIMRVEGDTILILHLILCDLLYCVFSLPHTYYVYGFRSDNGSVPFFCSGAAVVRYVNAFAEWMTLGLLAIQRCIDITKPPNARIFKTRCTVYFVVGIWVLSLILQLGNLINNNFGYNEATRKCDCVGSSSSMLYFYTLESLLPCALMMFGCFSIIFQIVRNKRRLQKYGMSSDVIEMREKEMWQSACLILCLLLLFLACVIPVCTFNVLFTLGVIQNSEIGIILYMVYWVQYGINFLVYATSKRKFQLAYKSFFVCVYIQIKRCCHLQQQPTSPEDFDEGVIS